MPLSPRRALALAVLTAVPLLAAAAHSGPARAWVRDRVEVSLGRAIGARVSIGRLDYNLFTLSIDAVGVGLHDHSAHEPFARAATVSIDLPWSSVFSTRRIDRLEVLRPEVSSRGLTEWLSGRSPQARPRAPSNPVRIERLIVSDFSLADDAPALPVGLTLAGVSVDLARGADGVLAAPLRVSGRSSLRLGTRVLALQVDGVVGMDEREVLLRALRATMGDAGSGTISVTADGRVEWAGVSPAVAMKLTGHADAHIVASLADASPQIAGRARFEGNVSGPVTGPEMEVLAWSDNLSLSRGRSGSLRTRARVRGGVLHVNDFVLTSLGGRVSGRASVALTESRDADRLTVTWTGIEGPRLASALGVATLGLSATLDGRAEVTGRLREPRSWVGEAQTHVRQATWAGLPAAGVATARLSAGRWTVPALDITAGGVRVAGTGSGRLTADASASWGSSTLDGRLSIEIDDLASAAAALRAAGVAMPAESRHVAGGNASVDARLSGTLRRPRATGTLLVAGARLGPLSAVEATGRFAASPDEVSFEDLRIATGTTTLDVAGRVGLPSRAVTARYHLDAPDLAELARWLSLPGAMRPTRGVLTLDGTVRGPASRPTVNAAVSASDVQVAGQTIDRLEATIATGTQSVTLAPLQLQAGEGHLFVRGRFDLARRRVTVDELQARRWPLSPLVLEAQPGRAPVAIPLSATLDLDAFGAGTLERPTGTARLSLSDVAWNGTSVGPVQAQLLAEDGRVDVDVSAADFGLRAVGHGSAARPWPMDAQVTLSNADLARAFRLARPSSAPSTLAARATLTAHVVGSLADPASLVLDARLDAFTGSISGRGVTLARPGTLSWRAGQVDAASVTIVSGATELALERAAPESPARVTLQGDIGDLLSMLPPEQTRGLTATGRIRARLDSVGPMRDARFSGQASVENVTVVKEGYPGLADASASISLGQGRLALTEASARVGTATVSGRADVPLRLLQPWLPAWLLRDHGGEGPARAELGITTLSVSMLEPWVTNETLSRAQGELDVELALEADRLALGAVRGNARVTRGHLAAGGLRVSQAAPVSVRLDGGRVSVRDWHWTGPATDLSLSGDLSAASAGADHDVQVRGTLDLAVASAVAPGRVAGTLALDMRSKAIAGSTALTGSLELRDGAWAERAYGIALADVAGRAVLDGASLRVEELRGRLNGGEASIAGDWPLARGARPGKLTLTVRDAGAEFPRRTRHAVSADLEMVVASRPTIRGRVLLTPGRLTSSLAGLAQVAATFAGADAPPPVPRGRRRSRPGSGIDLDIDVHTTEDLVADSPDMRLQAGAEGHLVGTLAAPRLRGRVSLREGGELFLGGRNYEIQAGAIDFVDASRGTTIRLGITATSRVDEYEVVMRLSGAPDTLSINLSSNPPLGQSDLWALLTTGRVSSGSERGGTEQVAAFFSAELLGGMGRRVGLDTVRIEAQDTDLSTIDLEPVSRLTASKRLSETVEIIYSQNLNESDDVSWILVYEPWRHVELRASYRTSGSNTLAVRHEIDFGGSRPSPARVAGPRERSRVSQVTITGVPASEQSLLRDRLELTAGKHFDALEWQEDERRLVAFYQERDRLQARVRPSRTPGPDGSLALAYAIEPGPRTRLEVRGYTPSDDTLAALREAWTGIGFEDFLAEEFDELIRLDLAGKGFVRGEVSTVFRPLGAEGRTAVVSVSPGPHADRLRIQYGGNAAVTDEELDRLVEERRLSPACWTDRSRLEEAVRATFVSRGYLSADVKSDPPRLEGSTAVLDVHVVEGARFRVGAVAITGTRAIDRRVVEQAFGFAPGDFADRGRFRRSIGAVRAVYYRGGFPAASVAPSFTPRPADAVVDIALRITEGPRDVIREVEITGANKTRRGLLEDAMRLEPGGAADPAALDRVQQRLYDTGVFRSVAASFEPAGQDGAGPGERPVKAVFALEEWPKYRLRYGFEMGPGAVEQLGLGSGDSQPGGTFDLQRRNLFGAGITAGLGAFLSSDRYRVRGTLSAPLFLGRFATSTLSVEQYDQDVTITNPDSAPVRFAVNVERLLAEQRWRRGVARRLELAYGFEVQASEVLLGNQLRTLSASVILGAFTGNVTWDTRDNLFNPTRGMFHSSKVDAGPKWVLSDIAYARYLLQQFIYQPLGPLVFASGVRFGSLDIDDETRLAGLSLRFVAGGGSSVRGYEQDSLGPLDVFRLPIGGNVLLVLNEEIRFPIFGWFGGAVFIDAGNTFSGLDTFAWSDLEVGTGFGLRLNTPVAVIRVDLGFPVPRPSNSPLARWYFGIGQAF